MASVASCGSRLRSRSGAPIDAMKLSSIVGGDRPRRRVSNAPRLQERAHARPRLRRLAPIALVGVVQDLAERVDSYARSVVAQREQRAVAVGGTNGEERAVERRARWRPVCRWREAAALDQCDAIAAVASSMYGVETTIVSPVVLSRRAGPRTRGARPHRRRWSARRGTESPGGAPARNTAPASASCRRTTRAARRAVVCQQHRGHRAH